MATEADIPESIISITKKGEIVYSASGHFDGKVDDTSPGELKKFQEVLIVPPETVEYLGETKYKKAANDVGAEAMNTVNVEIPEGEKFLESPSSVLVATEDTCRVSKSSEPKEVTLQVGNERLESNKQVEVAGETGTEENKVTEDSEEKQEKNNMSHDTVNLTIAPEEIGETSSEEVEKKVAEKSINLIDEAPEANKPSERAAVVDEREKSMHEGTEETFTSTTDVSSMQETGYDAGEKLQEASSISWDEKSQDKVEAIKKKECTTPDEDDSNHKNNMDTSAMQTEETHIERVDSTEPLKVVSHIRPDDIIQESPDEVREQIEMSERNVGNDTTSNETGNENEIPEQKGDGSFARLEGTLSENEALPAKEVSSGENRYEEESFVTVTKENVADTKIIDAFEYKQSGTSNTEERPETLQQNEPEKEKLEGSLNVVAEDFNIAAETIASVKEETPIKTEEKISDEEIKRDLPEQTDANVSLIELNEKTARAEIEVPNKNANDLHVTHSLVEEAEQNEGKNLDKALNSEAEGKIQEAHEECTEEEKHIEDAPEVCPGESSTILLQTSIESAETTELIPKASEADIEKLQEASGPDFQEKSVITDDREKTDQEMQKNGEVCDTKKQEILASSADAGKCVIDAGASAEVNNGVARDEKVEQNFEAKPLEAASELTGQDESSIADDIEKSNNNTNEEEHDGTKIAVSDLAINEQVIEDNVTKISPESIDQQNVEICEGNKNMAEKSEGENNREPVIKDSNISCLVPGSGEQVPSNDFKYEKKEAEESTGEIFENSDAAQAAESITHETIKNIESTKEILDGSSALQGESLQSEERSLTLTETSPEEKRDEDTSPAIVVEEKGSDSEPVDAKDNIEKKTTESEEDLVSRRNEAEEDLPPSLSTTSDKNEAFNSDADNTPGDVEEGPTQNLEEALHKEENEKDTEMAVKNNSENSKTATEEDLEKIAEPSDASKSKESTMFAPRSEMDKMMVEDEIKKDESEQLYQDSKDDGKDEETEKRNIKEECGTANILQESVGEESFQSSKEEKVDQSIELEEEKIEQSPQGDESTEGNDTFISPVSTEQETLWNSEKAENTRENNSEQSVEERNSRGLVPESVEQRPIKNLEDDELKEDESPGEIYNFSETSGVAESAAHETSTTIENTAENFDISLVKQGESLHNKEKNITTTESLAEENRDEDRCLVMVVEENRNDNELLDAKNSTEMKPSIGEEDSQHTQQENEPDEKHESSISVISVESEAFSSPADKTHCLAVEGTSQDLDEAPQKEGNDKETEEKNDTKDSKIATEENLEKVAESSDARKNTESIILEPKSEKDTVLPQDLDEAPQKEENDKETEEKNDTEDTKIATEENLEKVAESSDARKNMEDIILEPKSEKDTMLPQDLDEAPQKEENDKETEEKNDTKDTKIATVENFEIVAELYEDPKNADKSESQKEKALEECGTTNILPETIEEKTHQSFEEEGKEEEIVKTEVCKELETTRTSVGEDAEKQIIEDNTVEQSTKLEVEKVKKGSKEDDIAAKTSKHEECEITQIDNEDDTGRNENKFELFARGTNTEDSFVKENEEQEHDKQAFEAEASGTRIEKQDIVQAELLEDQVKEKIVEENSKEEESTTLKLKDQVDDSNSFIEETEATISAEETVSDTLKDRAESNMNSYSLDVTKESQAEMPTEETNESPIEESANVSHMSNKETEEEIEEKEESAISDSHSACITVEREEKGLQEAEPEDKMWVESVGPPSEEKGIAETETKQTTRENVDISVKPEDTSDSGEKRDSEIPTVDDKAGETNEGLIEESARVSHTPIKETEGEITEKEETTIEDSESAPISVVTEAKALLEAEAEDQEQVESVGPAFEEKSIAETETKGTALESVDHTVEAEVTSDLGKKKDHEKPTVADTSREANGDLTEESTMVSHPSNAETEEKEETTIDDPDSASVTVATEEKGLQEAEAEDIKQVEVVGPAFEEKGMAETETEETASESVDNTVEAEVTSDLGEKSDHEKPTVADTGRETNGDPTEESAMLPHMSNEETEEKEATAIDDRDSASVAVVTEEKGLQEAEAEDIKQVESVGPAFEEKGMAETETKETALERVHNTLEAEVTSDLGEKRDHEKPTEESAMVSHMSNEESEEKEGTTIDDPDSASVTVVAEEKGLQEAEAEDIKQVESAGPACEGITETETKETALERVDNTLEAEVTSDLGEKRDHEKPTVADTGRETNGDPTEESAMVSDMSNAETEEKEETTIDDPDSASIAVVTEEKALQEAEAEDIKQVESAGPACEGITETETKEKALERVDNTLEAEVTSDLGEKRDHEKPTVADTGRETNGDLTEESAMVSDMSNEETEEKEETTIDDPDSASVAVVTEEKGLQEAEAEDIKQVESAGPACEGITETETKEKALERVDNTLEAEVTSDLGEKRGHEKPTVADTGRETNGDLTEESAMVSDMSNEETEEKEETTIDDPDSASVAVLTEEKGLQEAEAEDIKQVESVGPAFEEKGMAETETKETALERVDNTLEAEVTSDSGEKRDHEKPTVADTGRETNGDLTEESVMVSHMSNEESEEKEETTIDDPDSASVTVVTEEKGLLEAEAEDIKQVEIVGPAFEEKGMAETETKETASESVDNTVEAEVTSDLGEKRDHEKPTVADTDRETNGDPTEESAMVSHMSNEETEEKEETTIDDPDSTSVEVVTEGKELHEAEAEDIQQVESVDPAFEEKGIAEIETALETVDNNVKPEDTADSGEKTETEIPTVADAARKTKEGLVEESSMVSHTSNKETEEEIKEKEETSVQDLNSTSITVGTEAKGLQQAEPEDKKQVDSFAPHFEGKDTAEIETKETAIESVDMMVKSEDSSDLGWKNDNEIPTVVDKAGETNVDLVEESAIVSRTPNKDIEEEISGVGETTIEDSDSVSITVVTETKGLQEAEPEEEKQLESAGPTFEGKSMEEIETKETTLESVDVNMNADDTSDLGKNKDDENTTVADKAREINGGLIEESAMVSTSNKETEDEIEEKAETSIDDSDSASIAVVTEEKGSQEVEPEGKRQVEIIVPTSEEKGVSEIETKETMLGSVDVNVKPEDASDLDKKGDSENPTVADYDISTVTDTVGEINEGLIEESAMLSHTSDKETEEEIIKKEETTIGDSDSAAVTAVTEAKCSQEAEAVDQKQVESVGPAFEEKSITEIETKETMLGSVDVNVKPEYTSDLGEKRDAEIPTVADAGGERKECPIEESDTVLHTSNQENEEEIKEKEETSIEDSNSASDALITEAKGSQETEPEDKRQVEIVDPASEEKGGITETETKERTVESVDINVKAEDTSDLGEKRDREIPEVADEAVETRDSGIKNEVPEAIDHTEVTTTDKPLEEISEDDPMENSTMTSKEHEPTTTKVTETVCATQTEDQAPLENTETTCVAEAMDEASTNKEDKVINPVNASELESLDSGKETANEEDVEISKGEETSKLADQSDVCKSTTLKDEESSNPGQQTEKAEDEKPVDEALKTSEISGVCTESEKAIPEKQISESNLKEVVEEEAVEQDGEAHSKRHETVNNTADGIVTEEKLECTSEAVTENQTSETLPESHKSQIEENSSGNENRENDKEITEKEESQLVAEEHEEQSENETIKAVIFTEKEQEGIEQSDDGGDIKELVVEEERGINELHASSTVEETTDKMENSTPVSSEYNQAADSKEQMKAENSEIEEDSAREAEASLARETEELKSQDMSIEPGVKESKEKIAETAEESQDGHNEIDDATLTAKKETSTGEAELGDKVVKDFHIEETEAENGQQDKEVDNMKLEETTELASELPLNDNAHVEKESVTEENRNLGEPGETKTASETVFESRGLGAEDAEVGKSQTVEKPDQVPTNDEGENAAMENSGADEAEETKIDSNTADETKELGTEKTSETAKGPTVLNLGQVPSSDCEHTQKESVVVESLKVDKINEIEVPSDATYESIDKETEDFSGETPTVENKVAGEEPEETNMASEVVFEPKGLGAEETEVGKSQTVETPDQVPTNNDNNVGREIADIENFSADDVEGNKIVADEVNEIKVVSDAIYESKVREAEETEVGKSQTVEKPDPVPTNDDGHAERENAAAENSGADEVEKTKLVSDAVGETKGQDAGESAEARKSPTVEKMEQMSTGNCEHTQKESAAVENPRAVEVNEIKVGSNATHESDDQDTEEPTKEIPTVEKRDQVPAVNSEQAEHTDVEEVKETKKDQITEDVDETGKNPTEDNPDTDKTEEACKAASDYGAQGIEPVTENEIIVDQTPPADKLNEQLPTPTPTLPFKDETTAAVAEIEKEKPQVEKLEDEVPEDSSAAKPTKETCLQTGSRDLEVSALGFNINKDIQDSPTEVYEEEGQTPDETLKLEPLENENKMKCADSSSESKANTDLTGPTEKACTLQSETSVKALQSEAAIHDHEKPTDSEDTEIKEKYPEVISDVRTEENQCRKTSESNEITENEVSKEEVTEEKEVAKTCQPISLSEESKKKSLQEDGLKAEECREAETNNACKTTVDGIQQVELPLETEEATASTNIIKQVAAKDRSVEDSLQVLVENKTIKESFPQDFEGKDVGNSAIKMDPEYQGEESNFESGKAEVTTSRDEDSSMDISHKESMKQFAKDGDLIQETQGSKESSCATIEKQTRTEAELTERRPDTTVQTGNEDAPPMWQEGIIEIPQQTEAGDPKSGKAEGVQSEAEVNHGEDQNTDGLGDQKTEGSVLVDSGKGSLSDLLQRSRKETTQVANLVSKETEPTARTEENQTVKPETIQVKEAKLEEQKEEEEEDEFNKTDPSGTDAPVMVEASKDMDVKTAHKKSHNILSGMGSKVKHSISKVKKAITGKSSHTKPVSPK